MSREPTEVEAYKPRCDFAVSAFKEAIGSIDTEIEKIKGLGNMEEEDRDGVEMEEVSEDN